MHIDSIHKIIVGTQQSIPLKNDYRSEEKDLQPHIEREIQNALIENQLHDNKTKISVGGQRRPRIDLIGTNFWPDIEILKNVEPLMAIEGVSMTLAI